MEEEEAGGTAAAMVEELLEAAAVAAAAPDSRRRCGDGGGGASSLPLRRELRCCLFGRLPGVLFPVGLALLVLPPVVGSAACLAFSAL